MKSTVLLAVFAAAICRSLVLSHDVGSGSSGLRPDYLPVCNPENYTQTPNPPFPSLPDQFSSILEFSSSLYQSSYIFSEHYDDPGNRGRVDKFSKNGQRDVVIYDYDKGEAFVIPDRVRGVACGVQPLTEPSAFVNASVYGFRYVDGKIHIGSVRELFKLTENQTGINCGQEEVRGIPCNCWQTCHVTENVSYVVTYYFASTTNWNYYFGGDTIPVRIDLCETSLDEDGMVNEDRHTYSFFRFHGGPDAVPDSAFVVPIGLPCLGRNAGRDLPDLPQYFSMLLEAADNPRKVNTRREFYDTQLFRVDLVDNDTPYSVIHDFELKVQYIIDRNLSKCTVEPLANATGFYDITTGPNGTTRPRTPTEFFRLGTGYNFSYEGSTVLRGMEVDAWISIRQSFPLSAKSRVVNGTVELFYSTPDSTISNLFSSVTDPIPVAINITGIFCSDESCGNSTKMSSFVNIFDFSTREPDFDVFDTSFCAVAGDYEILYLIVPGHESGAGIGPLRRAIRLGITEWAKLPLLQVSSIRILGENGTHVFVTLQILPIPSVAQYPNPQSPQDVITSILNQTSPDGELPFTIQLPSSGERVRPFLLRLFFPRTPTPTPTTSTPGTDPTECPSVSSTGGSKSKGVTSGTAAALSIVMFIVGMICAMLLVWVVRWCQSRRRRFNLISRKYMKHENELDGFAD